MDPKVIQKLEKTLTKSSGKIFRLMKKDGYISSRAPVQGTQYISSGVFSWVWSFEEYPDLVMKVSRMDRAYVYFLEAITSIESIHLPKIFWHKVFVHYGTRYDLVLMENLREASSDEIKLACGIETGRLRSIFRLYLSNSEKLLKEEMESKPFNDNTEFFKLVKYLAAKFRSEYTKGTIFGDLHYGNVMMRGETLVITDPIATDEEYRENFREWVGMNVDR